MKVFISSTSEDLKAHRRVVADVVRDAQWQPVQMEHFAADPRPVVSLCRAAVADSDVIILLQAFKCGWIPTPAQGGDGETSITGLEISAADELHKPVLAFLAEDWSGDLWEEEPKRRAWVRDFRNGLNRNAKFFRPERDPDLPSFRALIAQELANYRTSANRPVGAFDQRHADQLKLRQPPGDEHSLPGEPYPLLSPYEHPSTFAGRDSDLAKLLTLVKRPQLVLCVHAMSGVGKSSLLLAGLVPRLVADGYTVSVERAPGDPGLARRLLRDIYDGDPVRLADDDAGVVDAFNAYVAQAYALSGKPIVFVLDQIDDALRSGERREATLARIGPLIATTAQRLPGGQGFPCKWLLCYRHEFHGEVREWLTDVLAEAANAGREEIRYLPHDLSSPQKSHDWVLPVLGKPAPGDGGDELSEAAFLEAISRPLSLRRHGAPAYPYVFAPGAAERLSRMFAKQRKARPADPLVPELQVILHHLIEEATKRGRTTPGSEVVVIDAPNENELNEQLKHALANHMARVLDEALPKARDLSAARIARTRTLLALSRLTDNAGRRTEGIRELELAPMLGPDGAVSLARLGEPDARLVVISDGQCVLSHDRLAEVIWEVLQDREAWGDLALSATLIELQQAVDRKVFQHQKDPSDQSALMVGERQKKLIEDNESTVLYDDARRVWWQRCSEYAEQPGIQSSRRGSFSANVFAFLRPGSERRRLQTMFGRYVSRAAFERLSANPEIAGLGGTRRDMTVLFSDLHRFTSFTERATPEDVVSLLNEYFTAMVGVVFESQGAVDKFVGDSLMALFGAPVDDEHHADHAVDAAVTMLDAFSSLSAKWAAEGRATGIDLAIGVNSGDMIAGNIGSSSLISYSVVGDQVNLAARLESLNREYGTRIIIGEETRRRLTWRFELRPLGNVVVKGRTRPVPIFEVLGRA